MEVKAGDMIKAIKLLSTVVPVKPLSAPDQNEGKEAEDYLEGAQFKQIFVKGDMNFIYQGNGQPQFGQLRPEEPPEALEGLESGEIIDSE
jgi:hypothetical protein